MIQESLCRIWPDRFLNIRIDLFDQQWFEDVNISVNVLKKE